MYTKNPFTDDNIEDLTNQDSENDNNWPNLTENELKMRLVCLIQRNHEDLMQSISQ